MDETTYKILMGTSAFIVAMLGSMLATTTIPPECGLEKLRKARNILVPSYFVLALLSLVCCFTGYDHRIEPASTLFVASFQALLFTMSMLVFIRPGEVRWSIVFRQAGGIAAAGIILFVALFCFIDYYLWFFYTGIAAYIIQLTIYTRKFTQAYHKTVQEVEDYYDEDEENRLAWVKTGFYSALAIGIMAIPILFFTDWYKFFVPLYVLLQLHGDVVRQLLSQDEICDSGHCGCSTRNKDLCTSDGNRHGRNRQVCKREQGKVKNCFSRKRAAIKRKITKICR